jgi:hypothetical protein
VALCLTGGVISDSSDDGFGLVALTGVLWVFVGMATIAFGVWNYDRISGLYLALSVVLGIAQVLLGWSLQRLARAMEGKQGKQSVSQIKDWTRKGFEHAFTGKTVREMKTKLGDPAKLQAGSCTYLELVIEDVALGKTFTRVTVTLKNGLVQDIEFLD